MKSVCCAALTSLWFAAAAAAQQPAAPLATTTLPLTLAGVLRDSTTPAKSSVLIRCGTAAEHRAAWTFGVGERACDVAEIAEVLEQAVVIRNLATNTLEVLTLPDHATRPVAATSAPTQVRARAEAGNDDDLEPVVLPGSGNTVHIELRREALRRYLANLGDLLTSALATPHDASGSSGTVDGYQMTHIKAGSIIEQLAIQEGDVLQEFNGQKLDNLAAVTGLLTQIPTMTDGKLMVLRNDTRMIFDITVR